MRQYRGEPRPETEQPKINVEKLHFLIHPGFMDSIGKIRSKLDEDLLEPQLKKYILKAQTLGPNELMFAFNIVGRDKLKLHAVQNRLYVQYLRGLKNILGPRLVVLTEDQDLFGLEKPKAFNIAKRLAESRGYTFDKNVFSEAYGETLSLCVIDGSVALNKTGNLSKPTEIKTKLTDNPSPAKVTMKKLRKKIEKKWGENAKRVVFDAK